MSVNAAGSGGVVRRGMVGADWLGASVRTGSSHRVPRAVEQFEQAQMGTVPGTLIDRLAATAGLDELLHMPGPEFVLSLFHRLPLGG